MHWHRRQRLNLHLRFGTDAIYIIQIRLYFLWIVDSRQPWKSAIAVSRSGRSSMLLQKPPSPALRCSRYCLWRQHRKIGDCRREIRPWIYNKVTQKSATLLSCYFFCIVAFSFYAWRHRRVGVVDDRVLDSPTSFSSFRYFWNNLANTDIEYDSAFDKSSSKYFNTTQKLMAVLQ